MVDGVAVEQRAIGAGKALVLYPMLVEDRDGDGASARRGVDGEAVAVHAEGLGDEGARLVAGVHGDEAVEPELGEADGAAASGNAVLDGAGRVVEPELVVNDDWATRHVNLTGVQASRRAVRDEGLSVSRSLPVDTVAADGELNVDGAHEPDLRLFRWGVVGEKLADVEVVVLEDGHPVELEAGGIVVVGNEDVFREWSTLVKSSLVERPILRVMLPSWTEGRAKETYLPCRSSQPSRVWESLERVMTGLPWYLVQRRPSGEKATDTPSPMFGVPAGSRASKKSDL